MAALYGRYSIGCWADPSSQEAPDADDYFDDKSKMEIEARRLLRGGRYKSIVLYEWSAKENDYVELEEITPADL